MKRTQSGLTLVEVLLAAAISLVLLAMVFKAFQAASLLGRSTSVSYLLSQQVQICLGQMRMDFEESSLASIFVEPNGTRFSLASPRKDGQPVWAQEGVPRWDTQIFYTLEPNGDNTGKLIRWTAEREGERQIIPLPFRRAHPDVPKGQKSLVNGLLLAGRKVSKQGEVSKDEASENAIVEFVRSVDKRVRTYSTINPTTRSDLQEPGWSQDSTSLLRISLHLLEENDTGNSTMQVRLFVHPEN